MSGRLPINRWLGHEWLSHARRAGLGALVLAVSGCSAINSVSDSLFGEAEVILPGERISLGSSVDTLAAEPGTAVRIPGPSANSSWAQPGGTATNAPGHLAARANLSKVWSASAGNGSSNDGRLTAPPIVIAGRAYVLDSSASVTAIALNSGKRAWRTSLVPEGEDASEGFGGGLAADFGRIVAATGFGDVVGLDPATGAKIWTRELGLPIRTAPTASNGRVYVVTVNNQVHALDIETGEVMWDFRRFSESAGVLANSSPAVSGTTLVVPYKSGEILGYNTQSGKPVWGDALTRTGRRSSVGALNDIAGRPAISGNAVYAVSHSGRMAAISLKNGERLWGKNIASTQTPWVVGDTIFIVGLDARLIALAKKDGKVIWVTQLPAFVDPEDKTERIRYSGPVLAGGRLLVVSSRGTLYSVVPETGAIATRTPVAGNYYIAPVVAGGTVFLLSDNATLTAMR
ncbi:MAG: outer membrane protein assembly factor BamB family protein [Alphaproteobacteria bacterium]